LFVTPPPATRSSAALINSSSLEVASCLGPHLEDFGAGDSTDLRNFSVAEASYAYDSAIRLLQIANGAGQARHWTSRIRPWDWHLSNRFGRRPLLTR
jgi:hypothetical protein